MRIKNGKKILEKISVDRKIIEHLIDGKSVTAIQKILQKGKGYLQNQYKVPKHYFGHSTADHVLSLGSFFSPVLVF